MISVKLLIVNNKAIFANMSPFFRRGIQGEVLVALEN